MKAEGTTNILITIFSWITKLAGLAMILLIAAIFIDHGLSPFSKSSSYQIFLFIALFITMAGIIIAFSHQLIGGTIMVTAMIPWLIEIQGVIGWLIYILPIIGILHINCWSIKKLFSEKLLINGNNCGDNKKEKFNTGLFITGLIWPFVAITPFFYISVRGDTPLNYISHFMVAVILIGLTPIVIALYKHFKSKSAHKRMCILAAISTSVVIGIIQAGLTFLWILFLVMQELEGIH